MVDTAFPEKHLMLWTFVFLIEGDIRMHMSSLTLNLLFL